MPEKENKTVTTRKHPDSINISQNSRKKIWSILNPENDLSMGDPQG